MIEPPLYFAEDHLFDIDFHPFQDVLAAAVITGQIKLYFIAILTVFRLSYTSEDVTEIASFAHHPESARVAQFSPNG